jgi:translation initiation factor eIF-2B subunit alpha
MIPSERESLYKLFRDHEEVMGTSRTTIVALQSFMDSIKKLKCTDEAFKDLVLELTDVIRNTEPKIIPLIHLIEQFETELRPHFGKPLEQVKARALEVLDNKIQTFTSHLQRVIEHGMRIVQDGDFIIAHSPSVPVRRSLVRAHIDLHRKFRVLVLEQDFIRIKYLIRELTAAGVEHLVIPEYNLSHFLDQATKLFLGAISVTPDRRIVTTVGSANIVGLCHLNHIPVFLLVNSLKFAHQTVSRQHIFKREIEKSREQLTYRQTSFSHDMVAFDWIDHVITEQGEISR